MRRSKRASRGTGTALPAGSDPARVKSAPRSSEVMQSAGPSMPATGNGLYRNALGFLETDRRE